jgi:hypothetical protein
MQLLTPFAGACACACHDDGSGKCGKSCCHYPAMARDVADAAAEAVCAKSLGPDRVQSVLKIEGHEHNLVTLSYLTEEHGIKTLLKRADLAPGAEDRVTAEFMPAVYTVLECCASVERMNELLTQCDELRSIAIVYEL